MAALAACSTMARWSEHPFVAPEMLLRVTLAADVVFDGEITETPLAITVANPAFLGEVTVDGQTVPMYFAPRMGTEQTYRVVDLALRLQPRLVPGIVLTTAARPFPFAGVNVVIAIEDDPVCLNR